jgi:hypothetical protein
LKGFCGEFGFTEFAGKLSEFRSSMGFKKVKDALQMGFHNVIILTRGDVGVHSRISGEINASWSDTGSKNETINGRDPG